MQFGQDISYSAVGINHLESTMDHISRNLSNDKYISGLLWKAKFYLAGRYENFINIGKLSKIWYNKGDFVSSF